MKQAQIGCETNDDDRRTREDAQSLILSVLSRKQRESRCHAMHSENGQPEADTQGTRTLPTSGQTLMRSAAVPTSTATS